MVDDVCGPLMAAGLHRKTGRPVTWLIAGGLTFGSEFHMSLNLASPRRAPVRWATRSATGSISQDGPGVTPDQRTMDHADESGIVSGRFRVARQSCRLDYRVANVSTRRLSLDLGVVFGIHFAVASLSDRRRDTESLHRGHSLMKKPTVDEAATDLLRRFGESRRLQRPHTRATRHCVMALTSLPCR